MLLNNYYEWRYLKENVLVNSNSTGALDTINYIKNVDGEHPSIITALNNNYNSVKWADCNMLYAMNMSLGAMIGFDISSDTKTTDPYDYKLDDSITFYLNNSSTSLDNYSHSVKHVDNSLQHIFLCSGQLNNAIDSYTIRKVGIWKRFYKKDKTLTSRAYLAITNLDEPIIVKSGNGFNIVVELTEE